jgi:hypothetical protein
MGFPKKIFLLTGVVETAAAGSVLISANSKLLYMENTLGCETVGQRKMFDEETRGQNHIILSLKETVQRDLFG